jgi:hypothetical protein
MPILLLNILITLSLMGEIYLNLNQQILILNQRQLKQYNRLKIYYQNHEVKIKT